MENVSIGVDSRPVKSGFSTTSLVLGILAFIPLVGFLLGALAVVFGLLAFRDIKKHSRDGKSFAGIGIILGVLGMVSTVSIYSSLFRMLNSNTGQFGDLKQQLNKQILVQAAGGIELYKKKNGKYPSSLKEVTDAGLTVFPIDSYQKPLYYKISPDGETYDLRSLGLDGVYGTQDDILP